MSPEPSALQVRIHRQCRHSRLLVLRQVAALACSRAAVTLLSAFAALPATALADAATDWNARAVEWVAAAGIANQPAHRALAISHTAAWQAADAVARTAGGAVAVEAAIASAHCQALAKLLPTQQAVIDGTCKAALQALPAGAARDAGIAAGERAANDVVASRADDGAIAADTWRPHTTPGRWVPTTAPASPHWGQRKPWLMASPKQFRPGPPPGLDSDRWARDYEEVRALGSAKSTRRSAEQTAVARFWETTHPSIYHAVVRAVADRPGRDPVRNARLLAAYSQAIDDAMIAVWDAKYQYGFWRPITAIRNGDIDGNDATERESGWTPLVNTPAHPEYPCAHCVQAGVAQAVLTADLGHAAAPPLATASPAAQGAQRRYASLESFAREVGEARILAGLHFRFSVEAGLEIGRQVGTLAAQRLLAD